MPKSKRRKDSRSKFMLSTLKMMDNSMLAFYLAFIGVVIQFVHNLLAVAGTFDLFSVNEISLLIIGEWILAITIGLFFSGALWYYTIKAGTVKITRAQLKETQEIRQKDKRKYNQIVWLFAIFDSFIDFYFWGFIVFLHGNIGNVSSFEQLVSVRWILLIVVIPIVIMLPQTLRLYAGEIEYK